MWLLFKNSTKKIIKSFGRFISISIIILIGIGVFIGLREATPGMLYTADNYYDKYNLMDFKIVSNYGFTDDDIEAIEQLDSVQKVIPTYSTDIVENGRTIRIHALEEQVNNVYLIDGEIPQNSNECLGDFKKYRVGDNIKFEQQGEYLNIDGCTIVGTIKSGLYLNNSYGISNVGDGKLSSFIFVPNTVFNFNYYTEAYIIAESSRSQHSYKSEYQDIIDNLKDELLELKSIRENIRYEEILDNAKLEFKGNNAFSNFNEMEFNYIEQIEKPIWYLFDRNDIPGYQGYKDDALKVEAISKVLPIFFIIVVMLMCLNTLTRLIEEERTEIGILQSNGFSKTSIILSYLYYVFTSTIIGIIGGIIIGYTVISKIIYGVFTSNYYLPNYVIVVDKVSLIFIIFITLLLMICVTVIACFKELKDKPSELLRPKAPKSGKKIFLEKFSKTWSKLSFMSKITIRNLFRYKKRILMTILGVSGCTALLLTGFGLNDSINIISKIQYNDIIKYDSMLVLKEETEIVPEQINNLFIENNINNYLLINQNAYTYTSDGSKETVYVIVPQMIDELDNYISLKSEITKKDITISDDGCLITSGMAQTLGVKIGDNVIINDSDNKAYTLKVADIVYNYVSNYVYISHKYYEEIFNKPIKYNNIIIKGTIPKDVDLDPYDIYMINSTEDIISTFDTFIKSINNLIVLIIVCACLLAFAVLYNLTIINVNERKREIATFKVLGFNDREIFMFIYRETFILSIFGTLLGLVLGIFLHRFVISMAQTSSILFLCNIKWYSYVLSIVITLIFSLLVQCVINRTLKRIDMIDSLKSVE